MTKESERGGQGAKARRSAAALIAAGVAAVGVTLLVTRRSESPADPAAPLHTASAATTSSHTASAATTSSATPTAGAEPTPSAEPAPPSASPPPPASAAAKAASASPPGCEDLSPAVDAGERPLVLKPSNRLRGADASSPAPWKTLKAAGIGFGFAAATHGIAKNPSFAANWAMMKRCGLPRAAYHFLTDKSEGGVQARSFLEQLEGDSGELPPVIDVEKPTDCRGDCCGLSCSEWNLITRSWVDEVERRTGRQPMLYTVEPFWNQCLCGTKKLGARPLWLAGWPKFNFPEVVRLGAWSQWTFYQYAGNVRVAGGVVDLNLFRGTSADLERWIQTGRPPGSE